MLTRKTTRAVRAASDLESTGGLYTRTSAEVYTEYALPGDDLSRVLRSITNRELQDRTGLARSTIQRLRNSTVMARVKTTTLLREASSE